MKFAIIGLGYFGSALARELSESGHVATAKGGSDIEKHVTTPAPRHKSAAPSLVRVGGARAWRKQVPACETVSTCITIAW
jgi:3-hydroxyisobutyrate dehydrogenase-like beta-hydroxyacid dehydrogenase